MPLFSILLPSRNRLDLLKLAVKSVLEQDFSDFEIVISDNASSEPYGPYVDALKDPRVRCVRAESPLSVTENWNRSLHAATGDYVIMLGDDDALAPGLLTSLNDLVAQYERPTVLYIMAYHYLYPGVDPDAPGGALLEVANSELFLRHENHYMIGRDEASMLARKAVNFQHMVSFNAQHFVWRRDFTWTLEDFFQPPYPDYFACFYTFAKAERILVVPTPCIIIGIAKQSFGFFFINNRQDEGNLAFGNVDATGMATSDDDLAAALTFPGPVHYRNWLLTSLRYKTTVDNSFVVDTDQYRKIQIVETLAKQLADDAETDRPQNEEWSRFEDFASKAWVVLQAAARNPAQACGSGINLQKGQMLHDMGVYFPAKVVDVPLDGHLDIMDAFRRLASTERITSPTSQRANMSKPKRLPALAAFLKSLFSTR